MGAIGRFEDLEVWQRARILTREVYLATGQGKFARDAGLREQIRRAAVSVVSNIAEGFERGGDKEFKQFLAQAKGSCGEVRAQLYLGMDLGYLSQNGFEALSDLSLQVSRMLSGLMSYLKTSEFKGKKFK